MPDSNFGIGYPQLDTLKII